MWLAHFVICESSEFLPLQTDPSPLRYPEVKPLCRLSIVTLSALAVSVLSLVLGWSLAWGVEIGGLHFMNCWRVRGLEDFFFCK
jgi:hypothetical protein